MLNEIVEFMGMKINLNNIKNPHLRRAMERISETTYKFNYDNHSRHIYRESRDNEWSDSKKYHETIRRPYSRYFELHNDSVADYGDGS